MDSSGHPVLSVYLDARPDQRGRDHFESFLRKELSRRLHSYAPRSSQREALERDAQRVRAYARDELDPAANGLALFACEATRLFEPVATEAPYERSELYVGPRPHLYPLMRLIGRYPHYAALVADTHSARLYVFALGARLSEQRVENEKLNRTQVGGWSQMRYQRHVDDHYLHHAKEVVEALDHLVRREGVDHVVLAGEEIILRLIRQHLPDPLAARVVDVLRMETKASEREVLEATLRALRDREAVTDTERVQRMLDQYRAGGLAVVGPRETQGALALGQVDELLIGTDPGIVREVDESEASPPPAPNGGTEDQVRLSDELVTRARQTGAKVTFVEDRALLVDVGGVGALLRYRGEFASGEARLGRS